MRPPHGVSTTPALYTPAFYRPPYVAAHVPSRAWKGGGLGEIDVCACCSSLSLTFRRHSSPSVSPLEGKRDETRRHVFLYFVIFFFCGTLNHLLVRAGVYTRWAIGRTTIGDVPVCMSEEEGEGFRWLIEREPSKCPRECKGCASALDNDRDRPATIVVADVYTLMIIQVH